MNIYRKLLIGLIAVFFILAGTACSKSGMENKTLGKTKLIADKDKIYVGFMLDTLQDERWYKDKKLFEEQVKKLGAEVKTLAANGNSNVQISQAELLIAEGADVLVVVPYDADAAAKIVKIAHKADVKVVSYDRLIKNADVDYYVSFDNVKVGELQAEQVLKEKKSGQFAYIGGSKTDNNAILFRQGTMNTLQPFIKSGKVKFVYDQYTEEWNPDKAEENMRAALKQTGNKIDAVIAANDGLAGGVIHALTGAGLTGKVPVTGQDAELEAIRRVYSGKQTMTVYKPISLLAKKSAEVAVKAGEKKQIPTGTSIDNGKIKVPSILLDPIAVTKNNIKDTVIKDGYLQEKDIIKR